MDLNCFNYDDDDKPYYNMFIICLCVALLGTENRNFRYINIGRQLVYLLPILKNRSSDDFIIVYNIMRFRNWLNIIILL